MRPYKKLLGVDRRLKAQPKPPQRGRCTRLVFAVPELGPAQRLAPLIALVRLLPTAPRAKLTQRLFQVLAKRLNELKRGESTRAKGRVKAGKAARAASPPSNARATKSRLTSPDKP